MPKVGSVDLEAGYITIDKGSGPPTRYPIANVMRSADVPDVPIASLTLLTKLAEVLVVIVKTLEERGILDEDFKDDYDLQYIVDTLETDLGISW